MLARSRRSFVRMMSLCPLMLVLACSIVHADQIALPKPSLDGKMSVEKAMATRTTARAYGPAPLTLADVAQILWAGNGDIPADAVSAATKKVIPSARKTYPIELYLVCGDQTVKGLPAGTYHYDADHHALQKVSGGDLRKPLAAACKGQSWMVQAPVSVVVGSVFSRAQATSGSDRGINFGVLEAGNANQDILLQARALGLETNTVGGLKDEPVVKALGLPQDVRPVVIVTVGKKS